jgi:catechol 2,3-dioxygenase-like lactoylglutathione lyase family enzyme
MRIIPTCIIVMSTGRSGQRELRSPNLKGHTLTDALTHGVHHVGLAVRDLDEATSFFCGTLGFKEVARNEGYPAVFVSDGTVTLTIWRVTDPANAVAFNRKTNIGLHHLALAVADEAALAKVYERVRNHPGVVVEFNPEPIRPGSATRHFICAIPGGIRVEFATRAS